MDDVLIQFRHLEKIKFLISENQVLISSLPANPFLRNVAGQLSLAKLIAAEICSEVTA